MKLTHEQGDPRSLTLLAENARFMPHEVFARLVANIQRFGVLQQWPLVWHDVESGERHVLSGNHRVEAAIQAGLTTIDWTETDEPLTPQQRTAIALSHNAIVGEDDPTILKRMYESIQDVDERLFTGLNDASLGLMDDVDMSGLAEANLDFTTVSIVFLPPEYDRALAAIDEARRMSSGVTWLARDTQHHSVLDAIEDARESAHVINVATALDVLLDVWDTHRDDLAKNWLASDGHVIGNPKDDVPVTSVTGHVLPAASGAFLKRAIDKVIARGDATTAWGALEHLAGLYLDEAPPSTEKPKAKKKPAKKETSRG